MPAAILSVRSSSSTKKIQMTIEKVGKRISLDGELGTVRFYGEVPEGSGKFWYGIEWDNQTRGKHSGTHDGVRYFECEVDGSGSFLKPNSKIHFGVDFVEALNEKYSFDRLKYESKIQSLSLEVNVDKGSRDGPKQIGLIGDKVVVAKQPVPESVSLNLEDLDLSSNLFASFDDILDILIQLPNLKVLRLNFNRFKISNTHDRETCFKNLRVLSLNFTRTTWDSYASCVSSYFNQLEELYLVSNGINSLKVSSDNLNCLKVLNLDKNLMTEWCEISKILGKLPSLESLSIEENNIRTIKYESGTFTALKQLNLSANLISSYDSIDALTSFPSLRELRLKNIPLFEGLKSGETRVQVVSRIGKLVQFNGSEIRDRDRKDDELYYLGIIHKQVYNASCVGDKESIIRANPRYRNLIDIYGEPAVSKETKNQLKNDLLHMEFCLSDDTVFGKKTFPKSTSLRIVKMYAQKLLNQQKKGKISFMIYKGDIEVELSDDFKSLDFYGLSPKSAEDVFRIFVQTE
jgi:hypothetical protein